MRKIEKKSSDPSPTIRKTITAQAITHSQGIRNEMTRQTKIKFLPSLF